jgi:hypothetical protein
MKHTCLCYRIPVDKYVHIYIYIQKLFKTILTIGKTIGAPHDNNEDDASS